MSEASEESSVVSPEVVAQCLATLRRAPAGLITDIDGTISPIAATPTEAVVPEAARAALRRLSSRLAAVAVVSGRAAAAGAAMVGLPELLYIGNHGLERSHRGETWAHPAAAAGAPALEDALDEIAAGARAAGGEDGLLIENKRLSGTVHYRLAPDPAAARATLLPLAVAVAERYGLVVTEGRLIVELRPKLVVNKGTALADLVAEHRLRGVVFLGDDLTDVDGFAALRALRETGAVDALRVGVLGPETPPIVLTEIDVAVRGVPECVALLTALADALEADAGDEARDGRARNGGARG